jgi:hypothetical protein
MEKYKIREDLRHIYKANQCSDIRDCVIAIRECARIYRYCMKFYQQTPYLLWRRYKNLQKRKIELQKKGKK